jgi:hypothetical protein
MDLGEFGIELPPPGSPVELKNLGANQPSHLLRPPFMLNSGRIQIRPLAAQSLTRFHA